MKWTLNVDITAFNGDEEITEEGCKYLSVKIPDEATGADYLEAFDDFMRLHENEIKGSDSAFLSFELEEEVDCGEGLVLGFSEWLESVDLDALVRLMKRDGFIAYLEEKGMIQVD